MKELKKYWNSLSLLQKIVAVIVAATILFFICKAIYDHVEKQRKEKIMQESIISGNIGGMTNAPVSVDLGTRASAIHAAFHDNDIFGLSENEEQAMTELMNVPKQFVSASSPNLSGVYFSLYGANLKSEFQSYLSTDQWNKVSGQFS